MKTFIDALQRGIHAANAAESARNEISTVIHAVDVEISHSNLSDLEFGIKEFAKGKTFLDEMVAASLGKSVETEKWLAMRRRGDKGTWVGLARWQEATEGYPCRIIYDRTDVQCHDRQSLINAISEMLSSAWIGGKIKGLLG